MTVLDLKIGERARIAHLDLSSPHAKRLQEVGFVPGSLLLLLARAPLGEPLLLQLRMSTLMLRKNEAVAIHIKKENTP